ncbi:MAG: NAD(P)-dependent dehydrogenase (short-subunit alcohol dehydrogenase family) [Gammaproteobacteria bacterium]|jgi:NAD(P)-dependent dehydrogenase (short-subunit alcohol dehydrogenase family)
MANEFSARMNFEGRVALVTGGASGIGFAIARQLAELGAKIAIADINIEGAEAAAEKLGGAEVIAIKVDVSDPSSATSMVSDVVNHYGKLDILMHSAGVGIEKSFLDTTEEEWRRLIDIDLSGTFFCAQAAARQMAKDHYGRIVLLSSTAGLRGGTGRAAYGAAKGGVVALTKVIAVELAHLGITANALAPGAIETELVAKMHSDETRQVYRAAIPLDRYGTPDETAFTGVFLASEQAAYITGQTLGVDGGFLAAGIMHRK